MPVDYVWRLLLATALGAAVGLEREYRQKPAGLRTNILIAVGSALFTILSVEMTKGVGDPSRVAGQIVTGIGFLGGGAILRSGDAIHGMTTAATIWVNAAIGVAAGTGQFALAALVTALTLVVLAALPPIEIYFEKRAGWPDRHRPPTDR
jgi:putative Mg2+ transporter-C (MgtC) family protein